MKSLAGCLGLWDGRWLGSVLRAALSDTVTVPKGRKRRIHVVQREGAAWTSSTSFSGSSLTPGCSASTPEWAGTRPRLRRRSGASDSQWSGGCPRTCGKRRSSAPAPVLTLVNGRTIGLGICPRSGLADRIGSRPASLPGTSAGSCELERYSGTAPALYIDALAAIVHL